MPFVLRCLEGDELRQADSLISFITKGASNQHSEFVRSVVAKRVRRLRLQAAAQLCQDVQAEIRDVAGSCLSESESAAFALLSKRLSAISSKLRRQTL